ncbi:MAG TPA: hypothetical protein VHB30_09320, partial [Solirubrobacteraceae bacterium]|nr:hypothetical protein [Solirubrobacteraceae bacterium]
MPTIRVAGGRLVAAACMAAVAAGVAWRALVAIHHRGFGGGSDQVAYSTLATQIADHLRYAIPRAQDPFHWAPGAPALFAVGLRLLGRGAGGLAGAYAIQAIVSVATLAALYVAARRLAGP